ncbi:hypothetical protein FRC08_014133 [Ceratobasidium sp. 394]|nr:hypothetical protein FRC08_014133 [Ceratobasidium sp. 394]
MLEAGGETTASWLRILFLALVEFPEAQKNAQAELDRVVGHDRMPVLEDLPHLPYVQAIIKECHRWRPVGPLAIPHATIEDINYSGFHIPAGTTIFINTWGMCHDPDIYERPEDFWPDRWIRHEFGTKPGVDNPDLRNPTWFGSGRRSCPGVHLAKNALAINTMNLLWAFSFEPEIDQQSGIARAVDTSNFMEGLALCPKPFGCTIKPRSLHHAEVIEQEFTAAEGVFALYEHDINDEE